jgi:hypothetical protein
VRQVRTPSAGRSCRRVHLGEAGANAATRALLLCRGCVARQVREPSILRFEEVTILYGLSHPGLDVLGHPGSDETVRLVRAQCFRKWCASPRRRATDETHSRRIWSQLNLCLRRLGVARYYCHFCSCYLCGNIYASLHTLCSALSMRHPLRRLMISSLDSLPKDCYVVCSAASLAAINPFYGNARSMCTRTYVLSVPIPTVLANADVCEGDLVHQP